MRNHEYRRRIAKGVGPIALAIAALCVLSAPVAADDFYVSQTGDDLIGDGSSGNPWRTLTYALQAIPTPTANDTHVVHVGIGTWHADSAEVFPINVPPGVTIRGAGADRTVFSGYRADSRRPLPSYGQILFRVQSSTASSLMVPPARLTGLTGMHARSGIEVLGDPLGGPMPQIDNCRFWRNQIGITVTNATPRIERCEFEANQMGISAGNVTSSPVEIMITDNLFRSNSYGINAANAQHLVAERNRLERNGTGILLGAVGVLTVTARVSNNVYWRNGQGFVSTAVLGGSILTKVYHETFYANSTGISSLDDLSFLGKSDPDIRNTSIWASTQADTNGVSQEEIRDSNLRTAVGAPVGPIFGQFGMMSVAPRYVDPDAGNFRLRNDSPLIDRGVRIATGGPTTDFDGDPRTIGLPDIGADEAATLLTHARGGSRPGELRLFVDIGQDAGRRYRIVGSYLQTTRFGIPVSRGRTIPIYPDALFLATAAGHGGVLGGYLNGAGQGLVRIDVPNAPMLAGSTFYVVCVTFDGVGDDAIKTISNVVRIDATTL